MDSWPTRGAAAALLILGCSLAAAVAAPSAIEVTYVANEGFLIEIGGKKILIDALFYDESIDWCHVPDADARERLETARAPFDDVDLILVTHRHVDHMSAGMVLRHLAHNPAGVLVAPPQVVDRLRAEEGWSESYQERIEEIDLELFASVELKIRGIRLEAHRIRHGRYMITDEETGESRNKHREVENLTYLAEVGGVQVMHFGDAFLTENRDYFDGRRFKRRKIDVVFLEGLSDATVEILEEWLNPRHLVVMHLDPDPERIERLARALEEHLPYGVVFRKPMERRRFGPPPPPGAILRGSVVDERGRPVAGATVELALEAASEAPAGAGGAADRRASTDQDGRFELDGLAASRWDLKVSAGGFQPARRTGIEIAPGEESEELLIVLRPGAAVEGRVSGIDGAPLSGARVESVSEDREPPPGSAADPGATTDGRGRYRISGLPPGARSFSAEREGYQRQVRDLEVSAGDNFLDFVLEPGWEIRGWVLDAAGRPVAGARVSAGPPSPRFPFAAAAAAASDGEGSFTLGGLADGSYVVRAEKAGFAAAGTEEPVRVEGAAVDGVELRLERGGAIFGQVYGLEREELPQLQIVARQPRQYLPPTAGRVDDGGGYRIEGLQAGTWMVVATLVSQGRKRSVERVTLEPGEDEVRLDLELSSGLSLTGRLLRSGRPVSGARVVALKVGSQEVAADTTGREGRFELARLEPGSHQLTFSSPSGLLLARREVELADDQEIEVDLPELSLRGQVRDDLDGTPVAGAEVSLAQAMGQRAALSRSGEPAWSDGEGRFELTDLSPGRYRLRVEKDGYAAAGLEVAVGEAAPPKAVEVRLRPSPGLTLLVLRSSGWPAVEVEVLALDDRGREVLRGRYPAAEGGRVSLSELPAGSWRLLVGEAGAAAAGVRVRSPGPPVTVHLPPSGGLRLDVPAVRGSGRDAQLRLRDPAGRPYQTLPYGTYAWTLVDGRLLLPLVPAGDWTLEVRTVDGAESWTRTVRVLEGQVVDVYLE